MHRALVNALLLSPAHADDLRSCPSSYLLIQSVCASRHKETARESPEGSYFLAVRPAYRNPALYLHTLPCELPRQSNRRNKARVRNEDEGSLICKRRMTKELLCLFQKNLFSLSAFFTENPSFLQAESFTIPTRSRQLKHQLQEKFLWNAIKEIPPRQHEREKRGFGEQRGMVNGDLSRPPFLSLSRSVMLSSLPTSPDRSAIAQLFENTANHSTAADGERTRQDLSLS